MTIEIITPRLNLRVVRYAVAMLVMPLLRPLRIASIS
jgi:hypothetical protein